jgi:hypothetical protein
MSVGAVGAAMPPRDERMCRMLSAISPPVETRKPLPPSVSVRVSSTPLRAAVGTLVVDDALFLAAAVDGEEEGDEDETLFLRSSQTVCD